MVSTVTNSDVKQKDVDQAVVVAVTFATVFEPEAEDGSSVYRLGVALPLLQFVPDLCCTEAECCFSLFGSGSGDAEQNQTRSENVSSSVLDQLRHKSSNPGDDLQVVQGRLCDCLYKVQVLQRVNERLLEKNAAEHQLFDVILITTDSWQQQQKSSIINSTRHHGLEVSRFCFSTEEDYVESLMQNNVQLFFTTDGNEALKATQQGVPSALLDMNSVSCPSEQLRVLFCEKAINQPNMGSTEASKKSAQNFLARLGQMRQKFGVLDSPLCFTLVTSHSGKNICCGALKSLRSLGISVDEAYCLGGAPRGPILSLLRPHFLLSDGFSLLEG